MEPEKRALEWKEWEGSAALPLYASSLLAACGMVKHAFTTRLGGVSEGIFHSLIFERRQAGSRGGEFSQACGGAWRAV